jgi:hypothetical protein
LSVDPDRSIYQPAQTEWVPTPTELLRWWIIDERTGKRRLTTYVAAVAPRIDSLAGGLHRGSCYARLILVLAGTPLER